MDRATPEIDIETQMPDLSDISFEEIRSPVTPLWEPYLSRIMVSIARPRVNIGGTGPPGRVD